MLNLIFNKKQGFNMFSYMKKYIILLTIFLLTSINASMCLNYETKNTIFNISSNIEGQGGIGTKNATKQKHLLFEISMKDARLLHSHVRYRCNQSTASSVAASSH